MAGDIVVSAVKLVRHHLLASGPRRPDLPRRHRRVVLSELGLWRRRRSRLSRPANDSTSHGPLGASGSKQLSSAAGAPASSPAPPARRPAPGRLPRRWRASLARQPAPAPRPAPADHGLTDAFQASASAGTTLGRHRGGVHGTAGRPMPASRPTATASSRPTKAPRHTLPRAGSPLHCPRPRFPLTRSDRRGHV